MKEIPISSLMSNSVCQVSPRIFFKKVVTMMRDSGPSCIVVTKRNRPVGIITKGDLIQVLADNLQGGYDRQLRAEALMSSPPVVFNREMSAFEALFLAQTHHIKHLPIVDGGNRLCGIVTPGELLRNNYRLLETHYELVCLIETKNADGKQGTAGSAEQDCFLGIGNRQFMLMDLQFTHELSLRYDRAYSIILLEVDHFRPYCDHYGYTNGMRMLQRIVNGLKQSVRSSDRIYLYKEATLFILLPETGLDSADLLADRLVTGLAGIAIPNIESPMGRVTVSAGVASEEPSRYKDVDWAQHLERADEALLTAKELGRNQSAVSI